MSPSRMSGARQREAELRPTDHGSIAGRCASPHIIAPYDPMSSQNEGNRHYDKYKKELNFFARGPQIDSIYASRDDDSYCCSKKNPLHVCLLATTTWVTR